MKTLRVVAAATAALALSLSACAANETSSNNTGSAGSTQSRLSGRLQGTGASSTQAAQTTWIAKFGATQPGVTVNYSPEGSGAGRTAFINGGADFAGSDAALTDEQMGKGKFGKCTAESNALNLPIYISPIAIVFNVEGVQNLKLNADVAAKIFKGDIKNWNDPAITALNSGVTLPDLAITPVHRSDNSGTTQNFTDTLNKLASGVWDQKGSGDWPKAYTGGEAASGTQGVINAVKNGKGMIGYADESATKGMNHATFNKDGQGEYVGPTADAAAKVVEASPKVAGRSANDWALNLDRAAAGYPFVLVSYAIVCEQYKDATQAGLVKAYIGYISSPQGQQDAQAAAGNAPLSTKLSDGVKAAVASVK